MIHALGLVVHTGKPEARPTADRVTAWAAAHDVPVHELDAWGDGYAGAAPRKHARAEAAAAGNPDVIVTIGGDGTFLRGVRIGAPSGALILGVDLGRVGFLTEVAAADVTTALDAVHEDRAQVEERLCLTVRASRPLEIPEGLQALLQYGRGPSLPPPELRPGIDEVGWGVALDVTAANDVVFEKLARDRQASLGVYLDGRLFASYSADALIVASPTGSTAYSFASGGPVVSPRVEALVFTPVAPHMTFNRSLVVGSDESVSVRVLERSGQVAVTVDGQLVGVLDPGDWVGVYAAPYRVRLVRLAPTDFYARVRERFALADAPAAVADGAAPAVYRPPGPIPADLERLYLPDR